MNARIICLWLLTLFSPYSIVNGICLGLAGKPNVLNRANSLAEFIRIGADTASIEIELYHPAEGNIIILRQFDKNNKSSWRLNGQKSGLREVERKVSELKIQVDNLCQFLPQDRIHEFSALNNKGLLDSTVDAVGDVNLKQKHTDLKQLQKTMGEGQELYERKKQMLQDKTVECRRLEEDVRAFEEKKEVEAVIDLASGKLAWAKFWEVRKIWKETDDKFKEAERRYGKETAKLNPMAEAIETCKKEKEKFIKKKQNLVAISREQAGKIRAQIQNIEALDEEVKDTTDQIDNLERAQEVKMQDIQRLNTTILELEQNLANVVEDDSLGAQLADARNKTRQVQDNMERMQGELDNVKYEEKKLTAEYRHCQQELNQLNDVDRMKQVKLRQLAGDDCARALAWLRQNRDQFRSAVYEPAIISVDVKDPRQAKYVESSIPLRDLTAFMFEDVVDMNIFLNQTRNTLGLRKVGAVQVPRQSLQEFTPRLEGEELRRFGFVSYVKDLISAPDQVLAFLCRQYKIHNVPVFTEAAERHHDRLVSMGITKFFVGDKIQSISRSLYSSAETTQTREVMPRGYLEVSKDKEMEGKITEKLGWIDGQVTEVANRSRDLQENIRVLQMNLEAARKFQNELERKRHYKDQQRAKIEAQKRILRLKLAENNSNQRREELKMKILQQLSRQVVSAKQLQALVSGKSKRQVEIELCDMNLLPLDGIIQTKVLELEQAQETLGDMRDTVGRLRQEMEESQQTMKVVLKEAHQKTGINKVKPTEPPPAMKKEWEEKGIPIGEDQIETLITELQAKADCMDNVDKRIVREYRELKETIRELEQDITLRDADRGKAEEKMTLLKNSWLQSLENLIERINTNFSNYFASMGFAGEVGLRQGSHENDFENYGVCIRVKFRDEEPLQELTGSRQSGGERSVSTALYMMALQELTSVPFR